jgi:putative heme-binding domain-containing protein
MRQAERLSARRSLTVFAVCVCLCGILPAADSEPDGAAATADSLKEKNAPGERPFGLARRIPWTTSNVRGTPDPPLPFRPERVFPKISFKSPTVLTNAPGTDRFFVAEQSGKIYSFPADPACSSPDLFVDTSDLVARIREKEKDEVDLEAVYGLTFHPQFAENRYCYLCYVVHYKDGKRGQHPDGTRVVRLKVSQSDPPRCDPESEQVVITWLQGGHNGGCLKFGPDGFLYISSGDGGFAFPPDGRNAGQDVSNLLSAILRIDIDHPQRDLAYSIPADNPFVALAGARGEIWAYGLRNPWKMSFDRKSGELWVGDVGWELWELVYRVRRGDNYGWSLFEGRQPVHPERQRGPTPIVPPTVEIPHTDGASVTGGFVYRGKKFPELAGTYLFGDWETRRIWGVDADAKAVGPRREIVEPSVRIVDFSEDQSGELYLLDYDAGSIHALARNSPQTPQHRFPRRLSESGLFASVAEHRPAAGVLPFSINAPQWCDRATGERFIAVPGTDPIRVHRAARPVLGSMFTRKVDYPAGTVLMKTLSLEMTPGRPETKQRIETQLLHFDGRDWRGYSYRWNDAETDADLVDAEGQTRQLTISDPETPGGRRQQTWTYASRTDCLRCHTPWAEFALAFNTPQINRDHDYAGVVDNQIRVFRHIGLWQDDETPSSSPAAGEKPAGPKPPDELPRYPDPFDREAELAGRGRAYLHVHCAPCHRANGGGSAYVHLSDDVPIAEGKVLAVRPSQGTFGVPHAQIAAPGDPYRSMIYLRMAKLGAGHMPHIGSSIIDPAGLELIHEWIVRLPRQPESPPPLERPAALDRLTQATGELPDADRQRLVDELLSTPGTAAMLARAVRERAIADALRPVIIATAEKHADAAVRDLFEPFVPEEQRTKRLGDLIQADEILKLPGDIPRGRLLFHKTAGIQCRNCHRIAGDGIELGPDLSQIGKKLDRAKLFESILDPSKNIDPEFLTWVVETKAGKVLSGLVVRKDAAEIVLKDAQNQTHRVPADDIESSTPLQKSLMPELLVRDLTAQQVADLLAYLESLK